MKTIVYLNSMCIVGISYPLVFVFKIFFLAQDCLNLTKPRMLKKLCMEKQIYSSQSYFQSSTLSSTLGQIYTFQIDWKNGIDWV